MIISGPSDPVGPQDSGRHSCSNGGSKQGSYEGDIKGFSNKDLAGFLFLNLWR